MFPVGALAVPSPGSQCIVSNIFKYDKKLVNEHKKQKLGTTNNKNIWGIVGFITLFKSSSYFSSLNEWYMWFINSN